MPVLQRAEDLKDEITQWRRIIHADPGLLFDVEHTADFVVEKLKSFGIDEIVTGLGKTGVVGLVRGRRPGRTIGLRADMDALPLQEMTGKPYASRKPGLMHACGHDGHTAMLLGAAKILAETRDFDGNVALIFQPAEEGGGGGREMVKDGMMERFNIEEVYGMHNFPRIPAGSFGLRKGPFLAAVDEFHITVKGRGGHAARPHGCIDPIVIGGQIVSALQTIASRNVDPVDTIVLSTTRFQAGTANNIIPNDALLTGTVRTFKPETRDLAERRMNEIVHGIAAANGATAELVYNRLYPSTFNHDAETDHAIAAAIDIVGEKAVMGDLPPLMGGEDFSFMLEARPGAFIGIGNGDTADVHHPEYDFNDDIIPFGVSYWVVLAGQRLQALSQLKAA
jgi:hippurate hydrolase